MWRSVVCFGFVLKQWAENISNIYKIFEPHCVFIGFNLTFIGILEMVDRRPEEKNHEFKFVLLQQQKFCLHRESDFYAAFLLFSVYIFLSVRDLFILE